MKTEMPELLMSDKWRETARRVPVDGWDDTGVLLGLLVDALPPGYLLQLDRNNDGTWDIAYYDPGYLPFTAQAEHLGHAIALALVDIDNERREEE